MSDLAAGGYYIAMPAQVIVAQPSTLTGSIGIFGGKFVTGASTKKLASASMRPASAAMPRIGRAPISGRAEEAAGAAAPSDRCREGAESRTRPEDRRVAQGGGTGRRRENGLVDELGGLDRAIAIAKQRAKIPAESDVELVVYPPRRSFSTALEQLSQFREQTAVSAWAVATRRAASWTRFASCAGRWRCSAAANRWR
jgi:protease-4